MHSLPIRIPPCSCSKEKILNHDSYCSCSFEIRSLSWMKHPSRPVDSHIETPFFALKGWNTLKLLYSRAVCFQFVSEAAFDSNISSYLQTLWVLIVWRYQSHCQASNSLWLNSTKTPIRATFLWSVTIQTSSKNSLSLLSQPRYCLKASFFGCVLGHINFR